MLKKTLIVSLICFGGLFSSSAAPTLGGPTLSATGGSSTNSSSGLDTNAVIALIEQYGGGGISSNAFLSTIDLATAKTNGTDYLYVSIPLKIGTPSGTSSANANGAYLYMRAQGAGTATNVSSAFIFGSPAGETNTLTVSGFVPPEFQWGITTAIGAGGTVVIDPSGTSGNSSGVQLVYFGSGTNSGGGGGVSAAEVVAIMRTNDTVVFNVEKYGALSHIESTAALQAAIDAAEAAGGGIVYFPSNNYLTSNTLHFSDIIQFQGNSGSASYGNTISNTTGTDVLVGTGNIYNFVLRDMSLAAPVSGSATNVIVKLTANASSGFGLAEITDVTTTGGLISLLTSNMFTSEIRDTRLLNSAIGAHFTGTAVGRILIDGGGAGSGSGIGYLIDQGSYFVFDGVDMGASTNMIKINVPAFVTIQNCNLEGGLSSSDDTIDTAYVKYHAAAPGGLLRVLNNRFGAGNGTPLTLSYSISISNALLEVGGGNTFSNDGLTGQPVEEWGTIPCPTYITTYENIGSQLWVTNRTVNIGRKARQNVQDLQNSGRNAFLTSPLYWGAVWYDSRTNADAGDSLYYHAKMGDGSYRGVNLFAPYTDSFIIGRFGVGSNAYSGWNTSGTEKSGLDIALNYALTIGSDQNTATRTTATAKRGRIGGAPYTTSRLPVSLLESYNDASHNTAFWGGGWTGYDAVTRHRFYAASAINTTVGTLNFEITHTGLYANTNFHAVAVTATNFIAMPTNYVGANFAPVAGMVKLVTSNDWIYSVTTLATNRAFQINP